MISVALQGNSAREVQHNIHQANAIEQVSSCRLTLQKVPSLLACALYRSPSPVGSLGSGSFRTSLNLPGDMSPMRPCQLGSHLPMDPPTQVCTYLMKPAGTCALTSSMHGIQC